MGGFIPAYRPLSNTYPAWGEITLLPWDTEIFGFPVADFQAGPEPPDREDSREFRHALSRFCEETHAELVSTRCPAQAVGEIGNLSRAGFVSVDLNFEVVLSRVRTAKIPTARFSCRAVEPEDFDEIYRIAGKAFQFGRYHTDPRFPRELADRRYVHWMRSALTRRSAGQDVFAVGPPGKPIAFLHAAFENTSVDIRLAAVDPESDFGVAGLALYEGALRLLHERGYTRAKARISAANTAVVNIYAALGFQFTKPEVVLHWHSPGAPHLHPI
jgi:RimJ/RimL family protein N-acetyltransferase